MIKFGEYMPDDVAFENKGATVANNVLPGDDDYKSVPSASDLSSNSLSAACIGAFAARDPQDGGIVYNFAGTLDAIYLLDDGTFTDVSQAGGYNGASDDDRWEYIQVGAEILATNYQDNIQTYTIGASSNFADLGGSPPKARHIAKVGEFVVVGNTYDASDGYKPQRVRWAGIGTTDSWTVSSTTQADYQDLDNNGGWVQGIVGGEFGGLIFQEYAITRMTYVGSPVVFQFDEVKGANGALCPGGIINVGDFVAYIGQDGFYLFDGQTSIPIGTNKVNSSFLDELDINYVANVQAALYPNEQIVAWSYPTESRETTLNDKIIFYNYAPTAKKRWSVASITASSIYTALQEGYTLEQLDDFGAGSQTLETLPFSLDSRVYSGNSKLFGVFGSNNKLQVLNGVALDATIETGEVQLYPGERANVTEVRPYIDGASATVTMQIGTRNTLADNVSWSSAVSLNDSGYAPVRSNARYHRLRVNISGNFNAAQGVDVLSSSQAGRR